MKTLKLFIPLMIITVLGSFALVYGQSDWVKLGEKDVNFNVDHDNIGAESKGPIRELKFKVMNAPIKFTKVVINYKDGEKKEVEYLQDVKLGEESTTITIEGDGHAIKTIDLWYETDSLGGKKAKVAIYGRS